MSIADTLKQPAGPLPVGAWVAVVVGGLGVGYMARRRPKAAAAGPATPAAGGVGPADGYGYGPGVYGGSSVAATGSSALPATRSYSTNDEWGQAAISALIGHGYTPTVAANAVNSYLYPNSDHPPTVQETAAIGAAILYAGSPPSLPSTYIAAPPSTTPVAPPTWSPHLRASSLVTDVNGNAVGTTATYDQSSGIASGTFTGDTAGNLVSAVYNFVTGAKYNFTPAEIATQSPYYRQSLGDLKRAGGIQFYGAPTPGGSSLPAVLQPAPAPVPVTSGSSGGTGKAGAALANAMGAFNPFSGSSWKL